MGFCGEHEIKNHISGGSCCINSDFHTVAVYFNTLSAQCLASNTAQFAVSQSVYINKKKFLMKLCILCMKISPSNRRCYGHYTLVPLVGAVVKGKNPATTIKKLKLSI